MRQTRIAALAALGVAAVLVYGAGQRGAAQSPFMGSSPKAMQFQPVNMSNAVGNLNMQNMLHTPKPASPLGLGNLFHKPTMPSWPPKFASTPTLTPGNNTFQPNAPNAKYVINPNPPGAGSKSIWNFPYNPFAKTTK